ncbi:HNH endonuclease [candidate division KSB1 bacterium]|nr:HNH endonuclease [candidate division KSB1 bacterium]
MTSIALNRKVLILNQSYEPLSVVSAQKAIVLIYLGKAEIVEKHPTMVVRSIMISFPYPSIIRLSRYVYIPRKRVILSRKNVLRRDGFRCQYCGEKSQPLTVDHVIPKRMGGQDTWENLVCACFNCNNKKGDRTPEIANMLLQSKPKKPSYLFFIQQEIKFSQESWKPYLFLS